MVQIQVDLNEEENKIVAFYRIENSLVSKEEAIKEMIKSFKKRR